MIDFELIRAEAFNGLSLTNTVEKINIPTKTKKGVRVYKELWKVVVEIPVADGIRDFDLLLDVKHDFPLSLPKIYLSEEDYEAVKYIPHVDTNRNVCLFDQENLRIDIERPTEIIKTCIQRARKIITDGLNRNNLLDFKDEVIAYWENNYGGSDTIVGGYVGDKLADLEPGKFQVQYLLPAYSIVNIIIGSESSNYKRLLDFFKMRGHKIENRDAFFLGSIEKLEPPFYFNNKRLLQFIKSNFSHLWLPVVTYLNSSLDSKIFVFSFHVGIETVFFGFYVPAFKTNYNGWRLRSLDAIRIMSVLKPSLPITRLSFKFFSKDRIVKRTDGLVLEQASFKFMLAGLGSIGSNLLFYLSGLNISKIILVDPDILTIENINRHLLSFNDVGTYKVSGIAKYLKYKFPFIHIKKHTQSVVSVIEKYISSINEMDLLFLAVGKDSIENYILQNLSNGSISKPVVLLWVEPYLLGAHVLYIRPNTGFKLSELEIDGVYKYNVISNATYNNATHEIMLREAGCQSSYTPYGREAISRFFALFLPSLFAIIKESPKDNIVWTCTGDLELAVSNNIKISDFGKSLNSNQLVSHSI